MPEATILLCPDCGKAVEILMACGARSYFCNHCNELKSSKRIQAANPQVFPPQDSE